MLSKEESRRKVLKLCFSPQPHPNRPPPWAKRRGGDNYVEGYRELSDEEREIILAHVLDDSSRGHR